MTFSCGCCKFVVFFNGYLDGTYFLLLDKGFVWSGAKKNQFYEQVNWLKIIYLRQSHACINSNAIRSRISISCQYVWLCYHSIQSLFFTTRTCSGKTKQKFGNVIGGNAKTGYSGFSSATLLARSQFFLVSYKPSSENKLSIMQGTFKSTYMFFFVLDKLAIPVVGITCMNSTVRVVSELHATVIP